jgi:hypothetical protein
LLNRSDFSLNGNDILRQYQLSKIESDAFENISTIIIGDSSGGNAIDANYFTELSNSQTTNLCLTGSWGIIGSLGILKKSLEHNHKIKNVIIIQTLDIWGRSYPKEAVLELFNLKDALQELNLKTLVEYYINPKEILWHLKHLNKKMFSLDLSSEIDYKNDYVIQKKKKYSNNTQQLSAISFDNIKLHNDKLKELELLQNFCNTHSLNCVFTHGPIHASIANNSGQYLSYLNQELNKHFKIKHSDKVLKYPNSYIGDSPDHIDIRYKKEVTSDYFDVLKQYLILP